LPSALLAELGRTPEGRKVIQVGTDILLISIATGRILDVLDLQD
jgi:Ni/Co efflux regulator RcnB